MREDGGNNFFKKTIGLFVLYMFSGVYIRVLGFLKCEFELIHIFLYAKVF